MFSAIVGSRRRSFMPCGLGKSLFLIFCFAENRKDDFSLQHIKFEAKTSVTVTKTFLSRTRGKNGNIRLKQKRGKPKFSSLRSRMGLNQRPPD